MSHGWRIKLYKKNLVPDVNFFCSPCNWLARDPFPRVNQACLIKLGCQIIIIQKVTEGLPNRLEFLPVMFFRHKYLINVLPIPFLPPPKAPSPLPLLHVVIPEC